ncbi:collagen alpha-1(XIV) chain-like [Sphaerodactylus townsendi]|uniref:collagen alpha-1(XIV) chain-like n=1 Tax=Sphaerodactylus townsendi TaxID=933632 RepID=UPI0020263502|nr:collagen alpha-1(XIV) chain-like [Sphaerodactylus townsendi]XP_048363515.1 collagen alpha-1(XIV) chain-like [Sphaerodactylus townsendi]XP_048363516.1 collagen alpha-1(XIV) chain-like [Sphaerodactylus townsendi]
MKIHRPFKTLSWFSFVFMAAMVQLINHVQAQVAPPSRLRYTVVNHDSIQISWKAPKGQFDGYKLLVTPNSGGKTDELTLQVQCRQRLHYPGRWHKPEAAHSSDSGLCKGPRQQSGSGPVPN